MDGERKVCKKSPKQQQDKPLPQQDQNSVPDYNEVFFIDDTPENVARAVLLRPLSRSR